MNKKKMVYFTLFCVLSGVCCSKTKGATGDKWDGSKFNEALKTNDEWFVSIWGKSPAEIYLGGQKWKKNEGSVRPDAKSHIIRWNQTDTYQAILPAQDAISIVTGFDCSIDGKVLYAYTNEAYVFQRTVSEN
jgi:hypothetical protein